MKFKYLVLALLAICFASQTSLAQKNNAEVDVTVFESVLSTASWASFKYMDQLANAKQGNTNATLKLLEFSGTVDGKEALDHSVTLLELIWSAGDESFAKAVSLAKPKLKSVLLERLQLAQGRTKKEALRKPMAEWAPKTWDVLNGKPFVAKINPDDDGGILGAKPNPAMKKPGTGTDNAQAAPTEILSPAPAAPASTDKPKGKQ